MNELPDSVIYRIADMEVDTARGCILRGGEELPLNPKVFRVLVYLLGERHRLVTKGELMELFWSEGPVSDEALTQCIARLRRLLGDDPRNPVYLKTVPRRGYRFVGPVRQVGLTPALVSGARPYPVPTPEKPVPKSSFRWQASSAARAVVLIAVALGGIGATLRFAATRSGFYRAAARESQTFETAWWKLNEGAGTQISDSIHGLTAILPAGVSWTGGISGSALLFPGREIVMKGKDERLLPTGNSARTLTAWIRTGSTNGDSTPIFMEGDENPDSTANMSLGMTEGGAAVFGAGHFAVNGKGPIDDNNWHQVTGVFEGGDSRMMRLFVDADEQASSLVQTNLTKGNQSKWTIGTGIVGGTAFRGAVDDVRIFPRALRASEIRSLYWCRSNGLDLQANGSSFYFAPIYGDQAEILPRRQGDYSSGVRNTGNDMSGVMFVRRDADCALSSIHGADLGQDFNIEMELFVPIGPGGAVSDGGPYFRSRRANPGDGIVGGTSAGFWVRLDSTGEVHVVRLHPRATLAFSNAPKGFDPGVPHKLQAAVHGPTLEVALDGRPILFDVAGMERGLLDLQPAWETASPRGNDDGSAGVAFSSSRNRSQAGGQEARNIRVENYHPLSVEAKRK